MKNKILIIMCLVMFCGKVQALPQDWPCDEFELLPISDNSEEYFCDYKGVSGDYELTVYDISKLSTIDNPNIPLPGDCGTAGCRGTIKNLKTNEIADLKFICSSNAEGTKLICQNYIREEYWLRKFNDDEYRLYWCSKDDYHYDYIKLSECSSCHCYMKDGKGKRKYVEKVGCRLEKDILYCVNFQVYGEKSPKVTTYEDYENCVDLGGF